MKKQTIEPKHRARFNAQSGMRHEITRAYIHSLRGKLRGRGLMKALMAEKKTEK